MKINGAPSLSYENICWILLDTTHFKHLMKIFVGYFWTLLILSTYALSTSELIFKRKSFILELFSATFGVILYHIMV